MIRLKKKILVNLLILVYLMLMSSNIYGYEQNEDSQWNILIINSYHIGHKWESYVTEGFIHAANEYGGNQINIKMEYLDFRNRHDEHYLQTFKELLETKYPKGSIDFVYAIDDEAYNFMVPEVTSPYSQFYQLPLLFSGVDLGVNLTEEQKKYITGIYQRDVTLQSVNFMFQIDHEIKRINIIAEDSAYGNNLIREIKAIINRYWDGVKVNIIQSDYIEDIAKELENIEPIDNEIIMLAGEFQNKSSDKFLVPEETINVIKSYNQAPIYSNDQTYAQVGILGGCMDIGQEHGVKVFEKIKGIMEGKKVNQVPAELSPHPKAILDYESIYEYNINVDNIPRNAILINKKSYQMLVSKNAKQLIVLALVGTIIMIAVYGIFLLKYYNRSKRYKYEMKIKAEREQLKTDFIVNMSHELRTPLNIIINAANLMKIQLQNPDEEIDKEGMVSKLNRIDQNAYRLLKLANNIIDITKLETGIMRINRQGWNIVELVEEVFLGSVDFAEKKDIEIIFDTEEEEIIGAVDKDIIQRIILNLISNAVKFTPNGGKIYGFIQKEKDKIVIRVKDTGIGIPAERLDEIFDRFYQVDNSLTRANEGSGIGLCIVREMVQLHGGEIKVLSGVGEGTEFSVILPLIELDEMNTQMHISTISTSVNIEMSDVIK